MDCDIDKIFLVCYAVHYIYSSRYANCDDVMIIPNNSQKS
jgi:hypothetical protein